MKKIIDIILIILIFFIIYFLQINFFTWFNIAGIMPNLFVIFIMMLGLFLKKDFGFFGGIIFGFFLDVFIGNRIGMYSISLAIIGLTSEALEKNFSKDNRMTVMIITSILTLVFELVMYVLNIVFGGITNVQIIGLVKILLVEILYNDILIVIIYPLFSKFGNKLEEDFINKNFLNF